MPGPLLAVDAPFLLFRSFFALPQSIKGIEDRPIGALLGATNVLLRLAGDRDPRAIVLCFGAEAARYRVELYEPYHADRPDPPPELAWQIEQSPKFFGQFGWSVADTDMLEADDLLYSFARAEVGRGGEALIATGDRDMYQCAGDGITVLFLKMGISGYDVVDAEEVRRRYGVSPALVPDFIALRGDPSDGLPGAPGIGPKTAASLLSEHGSLEAVIAAADQNRPRIAEALKQPDLPAFKDIATLREAAIELPPDRPTDLTAGAEIARRFGMNRLAERLERAKTVSEL